MSIRRSREHEVLNVSSERGGVQSVEVGMKVLCALADAGGEQSLGRIAESADMPSAKAHRYLVSLMRAGFVERDSKSNRYVLGAEALRIGLVALARTDVIEVAGAELNTLRERVSGALLLAVWGAMGPTIVRWVESSRPVTVNVRAGSASSVPPRTASWVKPGCCDCMATQGVRVTRIPLSSDSHGGHGQIVLKPGGAFDRAGKLRYITMMPEVLEDRDVQNFRGRL